MKVILLEADRIGLGGSGRATGPVLGRGLRFVSRARSAGGPARGARVVRCDAGGAARAGRDGQAARHPRRSRSRRPVFAFSRRDRRTSCSSASSQRGEDAGLKASWIPPAVIAQQAAIEFGRRHAPARRRLRRSVQADAGISRRRRSRRASKVYEKSARQEDHVHAQDRDRLSRRRRHHDDEPDHLHRRADQPVQAAQAPPASRGSLRRADRAAVRPPCARSSGSATRC